MARKTPKSVFTCASVLDVQYAMAAEGRATMQRITVHLKDKKIAFIQREDVNELGSKVLTDFRKIMSEEVGDLLPKSFRFEMLSVPVSPLQEKQLKLNSCWQNENSNDKNITIQSIESIVASASPSQTKEVGISKTKWGMSSERQDPIPGHNLPASTDKQRNDSVTKTLSAVQEEIANIKYQISIKEAQLNSLKKAPVTERPWFGNQKFTCTNSHHRGHKITRPCRFPPCFGYHLCGLLTMHPEVKSEISKCDKALKDLQKQLKNKEDEVLAIQVIKDRTKSNFFTVVRPQLLQIDPVKYSNRAELDKDLRLLAIHCSHKVPPEGKDQEAMIATAKARRRKSAPEMNGIIAPSYPCSENPNNLNNQRRDTSYPAQSLNYPSQFGYGTPHYSTNSLPRPRYPPPHFSPYRNDRGHGSNVGYRGNRGGNRGTIKRQICNTNPGRMFRQKVANNQHGDMVDYSENSFNSSKSPGSFTSPMGKSTPVSDQDRSGMSDGSWAAEKKTAKKPVERLFK